MIAKRGENVVEGHPEFPKAEVVGSDDRLLFDLRANHGCQTFLV
jgi:hypothetical protein